MAVDAKHLIALIDAELVAARASPGAELAAAAGPPSFCAIWPRAKPILEVLAGVAILIPGLGSTAGAVLQGLIKVGDQLCKA